jgi:hypothetical protein
LLLAQHDPWNRRTAGGFQDMVSAQHIGVQEMLKRCLVRQAAQVEHGVRTRERSLDGGRVSKVDGMDHLVRGLDREGNAVEQDQAANLAAQRPAHDRADVPRCPGDDHCFQPHCASPVGPQQRPDQDRWRSLRVPRRRTPMRQRP